MEKKQTSARCADSVSKRYLFKQYYINKIYIIIYKFY